MKNASNNYFQVNPLQFLFMLTCMLVIYLIYLLKKNESHHIYFHQSKINSINQEQEKRHYYNITNSLNNHCFKIANQNGSQSLILNGQIYQFFNNDFIYQSSQDNQPDSQPFKINKRSITKTKKDGQWTKLYNLSNRIPSSGKYYFSIIVVKNQYFIKKQSNFNNQLTLNIKKSVGNHSEITVSRSDIVVGFFFPKLNSKVLKKQYGQNIEHQIQKIVKQSQKQFNTVQGIIAYGFNGRIYCNRELRTQQKIVKKNKVFTVLINRDQGYICWLIDDEICGYCLIQQNADQMIPFIQMFAQGSSIIICQ